MSQHTARITPKQVRSTPRWLPQVSVFLVLMSSMIALLYWIVPAEWVVDMVLNQMSTLQQDVNLDIRRTGAVAWRLRGGPMLEIHGLDIRQQGTDTPWLHAERVLVALPWRSVYGQHDEPLQFTRVELDSPRLHLAAFIDWLDTLPPADDTLLLPVMTHGVQIVDGHLDGVDWNITAITLDIPQLMTDSRIHATMSARYMQADTVIDGELSLSMTRPAADAEINIAGTLDIQHTGSIIPIEFTLAGPLPIQKNESVPHPLCLQLHTHLPAADDPPLPLRLDLTAAAQIGQGAMSLSALNLDVSGQDPLPSLHATGDVVFNDNILRLDLAGTLPRWPSNWPMLPPLLLEHALPFQFTLKYTGPAQMSHALELHLQHEHTHIRLDTRLYLPTLLTWLKAPSTSPLPPLQGQLSATDIHFPDVRLHGIEVELKDDPPLP